MKKIITLLAAVMLVCMQASAVTVNITDGIQNELLKKNMETSLARLLTEINAAHEQKRGLNFQAMQVPSAVESSVGMLYENSPFYCIDEEVNQKCMRKTGNKYQIRNIPLMLTSEDSEEDYQEAVVNFDSNGNIISFNLSIEMNLYMNVIKSNRDVADARRRELILDWTEQFRTAYNEKNLDFLDAVFSDDALIITGRVVERKTADGMTLPAEVQYNTRSKTEYLNNLAYTFGVMKDKKGRAVRDKNGRIKYSRNKMIRVKFDDIKVVRHPNPKFDKVYGVTLHQRYTSDTYHDEGYVFLYWNFEDEEHPKIHVRTWQPDKYVTEDEVFSIQDFKGVAVE